MPKNYCKLGKKNGKLIKILSFAKGTKKVWAG